MNIIFYQTHSSMLSTEYCSQQTV